MSHPLASLDTNVFIRCFESGLADAAPLQDLFVALRTRPNEAVTSELTLAELFAPVKRQDALSSSARIQLDGDLLLRGGFIKLAAVDRKVLIATSSLRQTPSQKLPDAIHVVTAVEQGCGLFMSHDGDAARLPPSLRNVQPDAGGVAFCLNVLSSHKRS